MRGVVCARLACALLFASPIISPVIAWQILGCGGRAERQPQGLRQAESAGETQALARLGAGVAEREYWASPQGEGLQAPNRAHDLRTWFEPTGVRVHDRGAQDGGALVALRLAGLGRAGARAPVAAGAVTHRGPRVEIRRPGGVLEWYENRPEGLEQGFTLAERPVGSGALQLELAIEGAIPRAGRDGGLRLHTESGRVLAYRELRAFDAAGRALPARFDIETPSRVVLAVGDAGARYPLVIDPLITQEADATLLSSSLASQFGWSAASAGDVNNDGFEDLIVGAPLYDSGQSNEGAAFVFHGSASGLVDADAATATTQLQGNAAGIQLGSSVASAGDVNDDGFDDVIVGAWAFESPAAQTNEGGAFVFHGSAAGIANGDPSTAAAQLESDQQSAELGRSVASAGDVNNDGFDDVIVGAEGYDNGDTNEGAAWIFHGGPSGVGDGTPSSADTQLEANQNSTEFGGAVAGTGDVNGDGYDDVIVGAFSWDGDVASVNEGGAFVFHGGSGGVEDGSPAGADTLIEGNEVSAQLGTSVATAGDVNGDGYPDVIVGAGEYATQAGAAFIFHGGPGGLGGFRSPADADTRLDGGGDDFGQRVASAGDVNGDGRGDVIVGAPGEGGAVYGAAYIFLGSPSGVASATYETAAYSFEDFFDNDGYLGSSVGATDLNGDGARDVFVGAYGYGEGGSLFVYVAPAPEPSGVATGSAALLALAGLTRRRRLARAAI